MIKKINKTILALSCSLFFVLSLISCGDDGRREGEITCLTNSTMFCMPPEPKNELTLADLIEDDCLNETYVDDTIMVFEKPLVTLNFSKPFNQCFTNFSKFQNVVNTDQTSVLLYIDKDNYIPYTESLDIILKTTFTEDPRTALEIRPVTTLRGFIKEECQGGIVIGDQVNSDGKQWLELTFSKPFRECYNKLPNESLTRSVASFGSHIGILINDAVTTVATVEELLNLPITESIRGINL